MSEELPGEERAQGFLLVDADDLEPWMYGRVWRINLADSRDREAVSVGSPGYDAIELQGGGARIEMSKSVIEGEPAHSWYPMTVIESVLFEEEVLRERREGWDGEPYDPGNVDTTCPDCGAERNQHRTLANNGVKCKECGNAYTATGDDRYEMVEEEIEQGQETLARWSG